jgi:hypothetical protein
MFKAVSVEMLSLSADRVVPRMARPVFLALYLRLTGFNILQARFRECSESDPVSRTQKLSNCCRICSQAFLDWGWQLSFS